MGEVGFMNEVKIFQDELIPKGSSLVGYSHLIQKFSVQTYIRFPSCISAQHVMGSMVVSGQFNLFDKRYRADSDVAHLIFALKHENFDLLSLKRIFEVFPEKDIEEYINSTPSGIYARKLCFLYEWLTEENLKVPDCPKCRTVPLLDPLKYFVGAGVYLKRYRLRNNLLGTNLFCPIIRKTQKLEAFVNSGLKEKATSIIGKASNELVARAASFMLLTDSKASFAIEGERVPINRIERWGKTVLRAGKTPISVEELVRLQNLMIKDQRFTNIGVRKDGVFLGERDMDGIPLPEFIGAKPDDLEVLLDALVDADSAMTKNKFDPILHAAAIAFGFIYIHPLEDGNGRLHRYLIHHVLAENKFSPLGVGFPISSSMLNSIDLYRDTLRNHFSHLMDFIDWDPTDKGNVRVLNDTRDLYCYFDCTEECEYLYECVRETIEKYLPEELKYLKSHDRAMTRINNILDIPDNLAKSLIIFIQQNNYVLSKKRQKNEFAELTVDEVQRIESIVMEEFGIE